MVELSLSKIALALNVLGGILLIIYGSYGFVMASIGGYAMSGGFTFGMLLTMFCGILAMAWSYKADTIKWSVVLIVVGILGVAGGSAGGFLVVIGGVIGLMQSTY